jgi:hypothetical protein
MHIMHYESIIDLFSLQKADAIKIINIIIYILFNTFQTAP